MTEDTTILKYENISKTFGENKVLDSISFEIKKGEIFGFIGPDGAGKTTLIRIAMGILHENEGKCYLLGSEKRKKARIHAGYVPQLFSLYTDMTVSENIALFGSLYGASKETAIARSETILKRTGLWAFKERLVGKLSGGMKQKLALATGLLHTPTVLFLDEPTTGVDPVARREFWAMLYELNKGGLTIIVSTPYMDEAELCTRKMFISNGKILDIGSTDELLGRYPNKIIKMDLDERTAKEWIMSSDHVKDANLFGASYHIVTDDVESSVKSITEEFHKRGKEPPALTEIHPGLEDLFVSFA
ncbi:MAG: ABC transporter ATP-binding protein [Synergistaceae bacterium]